MIFLVLYTILCFFFFQLRDLLFFVCIIAVVMIGYGVASRSMVYYPLINGFTTESDGLINPSFDGRSVFRQVIAPVYFFLHGEFGNELDNLDSRSIRYPFVHLYCLILL